VRLSIGALIVIRLSDVVAQVESGGSIYAMRYEPTYSPPKSSVEACIAAAGTYIDYLTALEICKMSWGKFQIMGGNLYSAPLSLSVNIIRYAGDEALQLSTFNKFIASIGFEDVEFSTLTPNQLNRFALAYNGSSVYAQSLQAAYGEMI